MSRTPKLTLAHVTHEAVEQIGGIGTVLEGLISSPVYQNQVKRSILVGPTQAHIHADPEKRLGEAGKVLYSSIDNIDRLGLAGKFRPIEWAFNTRIVYGTRTFDPPGQKRSGETEILLFDVFSTNHDRLAVLKLRLWERFGLDSSRYDKLWDYEEWVRMAEPTYYGLLALLKDEDFPCVMFSHEFMGMPSVLHAILEGNDRFRTVFHGHECATARRLVEDHDGHDTMFYNVLRQARRQGRYVNEVFGDQSHFFRHALVSRSHLCDGVIAVGDYTGQELQFLDPHFRDQPVDIVYNGIPAAPVTLTEKNAARRMLIDYSKALLGWSPDLLMTHVTRPVISKGLWRDIKVCHYLDGLLGQKKQKGVLYILTSGGGTRRHQDVMSMEKNYGWPRFHRDGYPDLVGPEVDLHRMIEPFNASHQNIQIVLVNQFGWSRQRIGGRLPKDMNIAHLRLATDVEFGMATYEPFGISPLEPLNAGAVCMISNVCGCEKFVEHVTAGKGAPNVICADYTRLDHERDIPELLAMTRQERDAIEETTSAQLADELWSRLPHTDRQREKLIESGQKLVRKMGWDQVIEESLVPMLERICKTNNGK
ncbi:MAG: hypothetical protein JJU36_14695 [Phycisphaeraceae bacterium]|nr:hypothetical protein [Phycisphaeraceae bacterium]